MGGDIGLHEVFGIAEHVKPSSYVDRGGLDAQLRYALGAERHIAMHGASKQGKSWLRSRALDEGSFIVVQCQTGTTIESLFTQALGGLGVRAELRRTDTNDFEGTLDFNGSGSLGSHLLGKLSFGAKVGVKRGTTREVELQTLAQTPGNLSWVARAILASERRLVIEDCHYLQDEQLRDLAFVLKALAGYNLHVLIAGIWAQDHLLTYYNGDLSGRVEDIHLRWTDAELDEVLRSGSRALNLEMSTNKRRALIADAAGSVGLLQQLAEAVCREERIFARLKHPQYLTVGPSMERARSVVAEGMRQRYQVFAANFGDAVRRVSRSAGESKPFLQCLIGFDVEALLQGIGSDQLEAGVPRLNGHLAGRKAVEEFLLTLNEAHGDLGVRPPVFSYNRHARKVYLVDHSLLYFRRYGSPHWPW